MTRSVLFHSCPHCARRRRRRSRSLRAVLCFLALAYLSLFVWPTPYRHGKVGSIPVRWSRVTGAMEFLSLNGWQPALPLPSNPDAPIRFR